MQYLFILSKHLSHFRWKTNLKTQQLFFIHLSNSWLCLIDSENKDQIYSLLFSTVVTKSILPLSVACVCVSHSVMSSSLWPQDFCNSMLNGSPSFQHLLLYSPTGGTSGVSLNVNQRLILPRVEHWNDSYTFRIKSITYHNLTNKTLLSLNLL